jgi:hypothetical protein
MKRTKDGAELSFTEIDTLCSVAAIALGNIKTNPEVAAVGIKRIIACLDALRSGGKE